MDTTLYDLATDCLRLVMHFFHPIQQCAQQIYHTALPLSPTSSHLQKSCLQSIVDDQLSCVTAFVGAPSTWGLLLRTIDIRPMEATCIATSGQWIIVACGNVVNIYDAITGVLQQPLSPSQAVKKIQASPDGSTLFFAHSLSITMWDVQTGGLAHTFIMGSKINDILLSATGDHIACSFHDSVELWNTHNKQGSKGFRNNQLVVAMCWTSPQELAVVTQRSLCTYSVTTGKTLASFPFPDHVWGMVYLKDKDKFLVGTFKSEAETNQKLYSFETILRQDPKPLERLSTIHRGRLLHQKMRREKQSPRYLGPLTRPTIVDKGIACMTSPSGVQSFSTESNDWTNKPPLIGAAASVVVSLNRNLVVQTKDSIQIFSIDVLTNRDVHDNDNVHLSHVYPLGKEHIFCLRMDRRPILLELETLREIHPDDETLPFAPLPHDRRRATPALLYPWVVADFDFTEAIRLWKKGIPIPEGSGGQMPRVLCALLPGGTMMVAVAAGSWLLQVTDAGSGYLLAVLDIGNLTGGEVYDITFGSETRFYLKFDGPNQHFKVPYDLEPNDPSSFAPGQYPLSIIKGQPEPLSEPRVTIPYALDANCEWVLDARSRKICWISPGNVRRGNGGHFWIDTTLVMVGGDGVVRKVTFKEPDC